MAKHAIKDVNPQWLRATVTESSANTYTEFEFNTPVIPEVLQVMEILKVFVDSDTSDLSLLSSADTITIALSDRSGGAAPRLPAQPGTIIYSRLITNIDTSGGWIYNTIKEYDLSDGNGNGLLYAKRTMVLGIKGISLPGTGRASVMILFRFKTISATELVGLIANE
jgi:hypothetical protein